MWKFMLCLLSIVTIVQGKERITLVENGKTDYVIQANMEDPVLQKAVDVINVFTSESTGAKFEIRSTIDATHAIFLEKMPISSAFPEDSYSIQTVGNSLYMKGSGKGVLFAAYRYVRDIIGGRKWYAGKENTYIPKLTSLAVASDLKIYAKPAFQFREV